MRLIDVYGIQLAHPQQASERATDLNRRSPPDDNLVLLAQRLRKLSGKLLDAERDQRAGVPESRLHLEIPFALSPFNSFPHGFIGDGGTRQSPECIPIHWL